MSGSEPKWSFPDLSWAPPYTCSVPASHLRLSDWEKWGEDRTDTSSLEPTPPLDFGSRKKLKGLRPYASLL